MSAKVDTLWQLKLTAPPNQVFCALVNTATHHGRLLAVENFGTALTFSPSGSSYRRCSPLRATVSTCEGGTLLSFSSAEPGRSADEIAAQAESVGSLIHQMRQNVEPNVA